MKIGLFGGTFNPVHFGHVKTVLDVKQQFHFDHIYLIPSALPPHKKPDEIARAKDRLEMTRQTFSDKDGFTVSDVELNRRGPSYTIDTVRHFVSRAPENTCISLILGMDAFL